MNSMFSKLKEPGDASDHINKIRNSNLFQNKSLNVKLKKNGDIKCTNSFKTLYNIADGHYNCLSKDVSSKNCWNHYKDDELDEFPPRKIADYNYIQQDLTGITMDYFKWPYVSQGDSNKVKNISHDYTFFDPENNKNLKKFIEDPRKITPNTKI